MRRIVLPMILLIFFWSSGCIGTSYWPRYKAERTITKPGETGPESIGEKGVLTPPPPGEEDSTQVEDDQVRMNATLWSNRIGFSVENKTDQPIEIIWADATVTHGGLTESLLPSISCGRQHDPDYADQPPPTIEIEPRGQFRVSATPRSFFHFVRWSNQEKNPGGFWRVSRRFFDVKPLHRKNKSERENEVSKAVGRQVSAVVPLETVAGRIEYTFHFIVIDAEVAKKTSFDIF